MQVRRFLLLTALVLFGALAASALAASTYSGHLNGHSNQKISFVRSSSAVTKFTLTKVAVACDGGTQHINPSFAVNAPIDASGAFKAIGGPVKLKGTIDGHDASGRLIVDGSFSGSSQNCTADKNWTASK